MKVLIIAPHYEVNQKNGANSYVDWIFNCLENYCEVDLLHFSNLNNFLISNSSKVFNIKSNIKSSLNVVLNNKQYFVERLVPKNFFDEHDYLYDYDILVFSFVHTYLAAKKSGFDFSKVKRVIILTHNFDPDIYMSWSHQGLIKSIIGKLSLRRYLNSLNELDAKIILANISEQDSLLFRRISNNPIIEVPSGTVSKEINAFKVPSALNIAFLGSLSTPFNVNGLIYFNNEIFNKLKNKIDFNFFVIGSNPTSMVKKLCKQNNWTLIENPSDTELEKALQDMSFGIMPFDVTQGVKVKIWSYLSMGLPILATELFKNSDFPNDIYLASNNIDEWSNWILERYDNSQYKIKARAFFDENTKLSHEKVVKEILF